MLSGTHGRQVYFLRVPNVVQARGAGDVAAAAVIGGLARTRGEERARRWLHEWLHSWLFAAQVE